MVRTSGSQLYVKCCSNSGTVVLFLTQVAAEEANQLAFVIGSVQNVPEFAGDKTQPESIPHVLAYHVCFLYPAYDFTRIACEHIRRHGFALRLQLLSADHSIPDWMVAAVKTPFTLEFGHIYCTENVSSNSLL